MQSGKGQLQYQVTFYSLYIVMRASKQHTSST